MQVTAFERLKAAQRSELVDIDGEKIDLILSPGLSPDQINSLERRIGHALPLELRTILSVCSAIDGCLDGIDFTGEGISFEQKAIFPNGLPIGRDGFGNFWVIDITPDNKTVAPVFFACHDAPIILYQSPDLDSFLLEIVRMITPPYKSLIDDVHEDRLFDVWRKNPGVLEQPLAATSEDEELRNFALTLPEYFKIVDLRSATPGMGFSWGRFGRKTEVRRHGHKRIFGYGKAPSRGLFAKLFGR